MICTITVDWLLQRNCIPALGLIFYRLTTWFTNPISFFPEGYGPDWADNIDKQTSIHSPENVSTVWPLSLQNILHTHKCFFVPPLRFTYAVATSLKGLTKPSKFLFLEGCDVITLSQWQVRAVTSLSPHCRCHLTPANQTMVCWGHLSLSCEPLLLPVVASSPGNQEEDYVTRDTVWLLQHVTRLTHECKQTVCLMPYRLQCMTNNVDAKFF